MPQAHSHCVTAEQWTRYQARVILCYDLHIVMALVMTFSFVYVTYLCIFIPHLLCPPSTRTHYFLLPNLLHFYFWVFQPVSRGCFVVLTCVEGRNKKLADLVSIRTQQTQQGDRKRAEVLPSWSDHTQYSPPSSLTVSLVICFPSEDLLEASKVRHPRLRA